ncbi:hypothetical protein BDW62DRAFT_102424 [Aspergillus aurantiobrunneus]
MLRNLASFIPLALLPLVRAGTVQDLWNSPQYPDFTTNYTAGTTVEISWDPDLATQFQFFCEDCDVTDVDLWLTGSSYTRKLEKGVNVKQTTSYEWNINLDDADVEDSTDWTLRFLPADISWGSNNQEISSAKFNLNPRPNTPSPSSTPSPTSTPTPTPTPESTSSSPPAATETPEESDTEDSSSEGLSTGAKAGIGVGVGAGSVIILALAFLLWRHFKALSSTKAPGADAATAYNMKQPLPPGYEYGQVQPGAEGYFAPGMAKTMPAPVPVAVAVRPTELAGDDAREMDAGIDTQRPPVELATSAYSGAQR